MSERDRDRPDVGSLADEAEELLRAISRTLGDHGGTGTGECDWCPLCRAVRAVRGGLSPEVKAHLSDAASSLAQAAAVLFAVTMPPAGEGPSRADDAGADRQREG